MSDDEMDERPSFGGLRGGFLRPQGPALGFQNSLSGRRDASDDDSQPRKRARLGMDDVSRPDATGTKRANASGEGLTFAQRQMAKMGWKQGEGLGAEGKGRLNPIEVVQRPGGAGVGAVREKTKQTKEEEKRAAALRGEEVDDSSEEERKRKTKAKKIRRAAQEGRPGQVRTQLRKPKYVTVDDLKADLQGSDVPRSLLEFAIDLNGKQITAASDKFVAAQTLRGTSESEKAAKRIQRELISCAESKHGLSDQKTNLSDLESHLVGNIDREREEIRTTGDVLQMITELQEYRVEVDSQINTSVWEELTTKLEAVASLYGNDEGLVDLQELVVAVTHPLLRSSLAAWEPLSEPKFLVGNFTRLKKALKIDPAIDSAAIRDWNETQAPRSKRSTNCYETMMYTLWLPRVSSAVRNDFEVEHPSALIRLVKAWRPLLPSFIYSNLVNQVIVPRIVTTLKAWKPSRAGKRSSSTPDAWIFPWLQYLPDYQIDAGSANGVMAEVKRKLRQLISQHPLQTGIPAFLSPWKDVLGSIYSNLMTSHLLPRLSAYLSQRLVIDPSDQDTEPLETVLLYAPLFKAEAIARLLAAEFFPKFHAILYQWLTTPNVNYDEVTEWWSWWKAQIPDNIRDHPFLQPQWTSALNTIGRALDLGERAATELMPPPTSVDVASASPKRQNGSAPDGSGRRATPAAQRPQPEIKAPELELTFRDVVTDWCAEQDLLCLPTWEAHPRTGEPLLRITANFDQRGGVSAYIRGDVLYVRSRKDRELWAPTELGPELEKRASER